MLHYVIDGFFPSIASSFPPTPSLSPAQEEMKFQAFYDEVAVSTARMVAKWQVRIFKSNRSEGVLDSLKRMRRESAHLRLENECVS